MKIKSITDVITNSSSETFIISYPKIKASELQILLETYRKECGESGKGSGMAGVLEVLDLSSWLDYSYILGKTDLEKCYVSRIPYLPESIFIHIDFALPKTIQYLKENFPDAYDTNEETYYPIWDKEGKNILRLTSDYKEWTALKDPLQMHGEWAVSEMDWWNYENKD